MKQVYDIAIIGAGPAGSVLASLLNRNYSVLLIDRRDLDHQKPGRYRKVCGGLLAPDAQREIARLGWGLNQELLTSPQLFGVRTMDFDSQKECLYPRHYLHLDREFFDRWLFSKVPSPVDCICGIPFQSMERSNHQWNITLKGGISFTCSMVIGADGGGSKVRSFLDSQLIRTYQSIQEWYDCKLSLPYFGAVFDSTISDFYSWTITKDSALVIGSAIRKGDSARKRFEQLKDRLWEKGFRWGHFLRREGAVIARPKTFSDIYYGQDNAALIGEAAGWISPSSAEGISYALRSAGFMAKALNEGKQGFITRYKAYCRPLRKSLLGKWMKSPGMYSPSIRSLVLGSRFGSL